MKKIINIIIVIIVIALLVYLAFINRDDQSEETDIWSYVSTDNGDAYLISAYHGDSETVNIEETYQDKPIIGFINNYYLPITTTKLKLSTNLEHFDIQSHSYDKVELIIPENSKLKNFGCDMYAEWIKNEIMFIPKDAQFCPNTFSGNLSIKGFVVHQDNPYYKDLNGVVFSNDYSELIFYPSGKVDEVYTIPSHVKSIGYQAFLQQHYLKTLTIDETVEDIGDYAFGYSRIEDINISPLTTITDLGYKSFTHMMNLKTFTIPDSITSLTGTFYESGIQSIVFGEESQLTSIGNDTFGMTRFLKSLALPKNLETLNQSPFTNSAIEDLIIQSDLIDIDPNVFNGFIELKSIAFTVSQSNLSYENHVLTMNEGKEIIFYLPAINEAATLYIDQYVEIIHYNQAINRNLNLDRIEADPMNTHFKSVNGVLFSYDLSQLLLYPYTSTYVSYQIPEGTIELVNGFGRTINLKELIIPESLEILPKYAFYASSIESIIFAGESKLEVIPEYALSYAAIQSITIPKSVLIIDRYAFSNTPLVNLEFEEGTQITNIRAFAFQKTSLVNLALPASSVIISSDAFVSNTFRNVFIPKEIFSIAQGTFNSYPDITFFVEGPRAGRNLYLPDEPFTVLYDQSYQDYLDAIESNS